MPLAEIRKLHLEVKLHLDLEGFIDQIVMNYYMAKGSSLGVHQDGQKQFHRPICLIRFSVIQSYRLIVKIWV